MLVARVQIQVFAPFSWRKDYAVCHFIVRQVPIEAMIEDPFMGSAHYTCKQGTTWPKSLNLSLY